MEDIENKIIEKDMTPKLLGETYMKYPTERSRDKIRYGLYECQYCGKGWEARVYDIKKWYKELWLSKRERKSNSWID